MELKPSVQLGGDLGSRGKPFGSVAEEHADNCRAGHGKVGHVLLHLGDSGVNEAGELGAKFQRDFDALRCLFHNDKSNMFHVEHKE